MLVKVFIWFPMISRKSKLLAYEVFFYVVFDFSIKAKIREYKNPSCVSIQDRDVLPKGRNFNQTMLAETLIEVTTSRVRFYPIWTDKW